MLTDLTVHGMHNSRPSSSLRAGEPPAHEAPAILFGRTGRIVLNVLALVLPTDASAGAPPETPALITAGPQPPAQYQPIGFSSRFT